MLCSHSRRSLEEAKRGSVGAAGHQPGARRLTAAAHASQQDLAELAAGPAPPRDKGGSVQGVGGNEASPRPREHRCPQWGAASSSSGLAVTVVLLCGADGHGGYRKQRAAHVDPSPSTAWDPGEHHACALPAVPTTVPLGRGSHVLCWDVGDGCPAEVGGIVPCRGRGEARHYGNPVQCMCPCSLLPPFPSPRSPPSPRCAVSCIPLSHRRWCVPAHMGAPDRGVLLPAIPRVWCMPRGWGSLCHAAEPSHT